MALELPPVAAAQPSPLAPSPASETTSDERWAAWQAKGAAHDRAFRRKLSVAAPIAIVVLAVIVFALLR
jgi:hypothetical protein